MAIVCINQKSVTLWYQHDNTRPSRARKRNRNWVHHGKIKTCLPARCHASRTSLDGEWMTRSSQLQLFFKLIRSHGRRAKYTTTGQVAQCSETCRRSSQPRHIRNKQASALDRALDEAQNEVDSEAGDDLWGSKMDDNETWTPLSSPIPSEIMFANILSPSTSKYLCFWAWEICANFGGAEEVYANEGFCKDCRRPLSERESEWSAASWYLDLH